MILVALFIGVILIVAAIRNSQGALFTALSTDVPGFVVWAAAIFAIGAVGFIPGLKAPSRGLLALVLLVLILKNYQGIVSGFQSAWTNPPQASSGQAGAPGAAGGQASNAAGQAAAAVSTVASASEAASTASDFLEALAAF